VLHDDIDQRVHGGSGTGLRRVLLCPWPRRVSAHTADAPGNTQPSAVMHVIKQLGAGAGLAAKPVACRAVGKVCIHLSRMNHAVFNHKCQHRLRLRQPLRGPGGGRQARVHQGLGAAWQKTVIDKKVFLDVKFGIAAGPGPRHGSR
jgi:hypothetical protein